MKDDEACRELVREVELGQVHARIWKNRSKVGESAYYEVSIVRAFVDGQGGVADTTFLGRDDLLLAARALDIAHAFICRLEEARGTLRDK